MTPTQIAEAWNSVKDRWIVRRNKNHDSRQWEVVHDWGGDLVSDNTMKVVSRHFEYEFAKRMAKELEDAARGAAVLAALKTAMGKKHD